MSQGVLYCILAVFLFCVGYMLQISLPGYIEHFSGERWDQDLPRQLEQVPVTEIHALDENGNYLTGQNDFFHGWQGVIGVYPVWDGSFVSVANYEELGTVVDGVRIIPGIISDGRKKYDMIVLSGGQNITEIAGTESEQMGE